MHFDKIKFAENNEAKTLKISSTFQITRGLIKGLENTLVNFMHFERKNLLFNC